MKLNPRTFTRRVMERQGLAASEAFDLLGYSSQTREIVQRLLYN